MVQLRPRRRAARAALQVAGRGLGRRSQFGRSMGEFCPIGLRYLIPRMASCSSLPVQSLSLPRPADRRPNGTARNSAGLVGQTQKEELRTQFERQR